MSSYFHTRDPSHEQHSSMSDLICTFDRRTSNSSLFGLNEADNLLYIRSDAPFCVCICGLQGSGKSHIVCTLIEDCMQPLLEPPGKEIVRLSQPMAGLVLHYDQMESNICESAGLANFSPVVRGGSCSDVRVVILVSPSYYLQRKEFYKEPYKVIPLMFKWEDLDAVQLRSLMRLEDEDT